MKKVYLKLGVLKFLAIKKFYNDCADCNDFYKMLNRRLKFKKPSELAYFLNYEFEVHCKEFAQY